MRTIELARKDLLQIFREKRALIFLLAMPVVFTLFFGFVFSGQNQSSSPEDTRLKVGILDQDGASVLSTALTDLIAASSTIRPVALQPADLDGLTKQVKDGNLAAAIVIPPGYSQAALADDATALEITIDVTTPSGRTAQGALQSVLSRLSGSAAIARLNADAYATVNPLTTSQRQAYLEESFTLAAQSWRTPNVAVTMTGPVVDEPETEGSAMPANPFNQSSPGMLVQFAIFGLVQTAGVLVIERRNGALQRLLTTPLRRAELVGGHLLAMFAVVFGQGLLLVIFGQLVLKVNYFREPFAILLVMVSLSLLVAALGMLIGSIVKTEDQVVLYSMIAMFLMAALGGAWFPLEVAGETFSTIGHFMPSAWAMDGFQNILLRGLGFTSVLLPAAIILGYAALFFALAIWKFKFE